MTILQAAFLAVLATSIIGAPIGLYMAGLRVTFKK